jgi:hypothetical protein
MTQRTYEPANRKPWQEPIKWIIKAIDQHDALFLSTGNHWHREKAETLRAYILELKRWVCYNEQTPPAPNHDEP